MKFMDRLSRLLGRHPDSLKTEADRPQHQSEHIAARDIEIHAADNASSRHKGASGSSDENFVQPRPPNLVAPHDAPHSGKIMPSGGVSPIDLGHAGSVTSQCHSVVTNNARSADNPRALRASNESTMEMSERLSWQETEHDTSEFTADLAPLIVEADTTAGATSGDNNGIESDFAETAHCEQQPGAAEETEVALVKIECPGCRAIYEVGCKLIPPDGRDMQCSNCGHEWFHPSDTSAGIDPPQTSPSAPEQPRVHHLASQGESKPSVDGASAPIERAECLPLTPSEVRLVISGQPEALGGFTASDRLHAVDPKGDSPLHLAARMGKLALCDLLIRAGADPLALNHGRQTSADVALAEGHSLVAQLLYSLSAKSSRTETIEKPTIRPLPDPVGQTASPTLAFEDTPRAASTAEAVGYSNANAEVPKTDERQPAIRAELDTLDDLLQFEAEEEPEAYFGQSVSTKASGTFVALVSSAPSVPDGENENWDLDLSPAQIAGDGIGSNVPLSPVKGDEHDFLKVRNRGRKSTKKAVIQTGTQLTIEPDFCLAWAEEVLAKGWCSGHDLDQLIDSCEGNGDPDELRINLERNLELVGLPPDGENPEEADLWDAKSVVSADDLADIIEVTLTRATRLPGTQRFVMDKSDEQQLLEPMMRAKQELLLGILASKAAVEAILDAVGKIADGSRDPSSFSLRTIIPSRPGHSETSEVMAASEALKSWHISGRVMDGKRRREALAALDALDLSLAYQKALVASLKAREIDFDQAVHLDRLISAYEAANERLIVEHLPYARRFAARNVEPDEDPEDVFQVAFLGLQRSTRRFDLDRGVRFVIYCAFWMKQALTRWRADEGSSIRVPVHRHEDLAKLDAALDRLDTRGDGAVSDDDLATELEWTVDQVRQFRKVPRKAEHPDGDEEWDALMPETAESDVFGQAETERIVTEILAELPDRQADVIRMRFGIGRETDMTLEEVGQIYGVTRERIRQIEAKALDFLSHPGRIRRLRTLLAYDGGRRSNPPTSTALDDAIADGPAEEGKTLTPWSDERVDRLKRLWGAGRSANEIAQMLGGTSRNAVIGKLSRLGLAESDR
jgi:RNA polymerase primary sigma factor